MTARRRTIHAAQALLPEGWANGVRIVFDESGIAAVEPGTEPGRDDERVEALLPTIANLHSHAFQRAMAGLTEVRGPQADSFWTWREQMYRFGLKMNPDQAQAVATLLYVEMLEAGFGRVGEFHYLHHAPDGSHYDDIAEMARRIVAAASATGIALTLLPVFYAHSTFGGATPSDGQRRFINGLDDFAALLESSREAASGLPGAVVGVAPHSLRAVTPDELGHVAAMAQGAPIHMHVAEQQLEVKDCIAWSGARPVEWLLANQPVDERWCLIHATHMTEGETRALAATGAVAGLCPLTEGNLGDGIFQGPVFASAGGRYGIGSDSNIQIDLAAELRQLEYAQRLGNRARNVMARSGGSTGRSLFDAALAGGAAALGAPTSGIAAGQTADFFSLDTGHPTMQGLSGDAILDAFVFAAAGRVDDVWVGGRRLVEGGRHVLRGEAERAYRQAMRELQSV
jgi:formimidoylglutamate deiminase